MRDALTKSRTMLINSVRGYLRTQLLRVNAGATETFSRRVAELFVIKRRTRVPEFVARQLDAIDALTEQIRAADRDVSRRAKENPVCKRLMTVPGVGPVTALYFTALVDELPRFAGPHALMSYLGLVPGENSSSDEKRRLSITKSGSAMMRCLLQQAAWSSLRARRQDAMQDWMRRVAERRGRRIAAVALARKIAGILFAIWRDGTKYQPERSALASAAA
jgi:transposase